jgi:hypothetical protein
MQACVQRNNVHSDGITPYGIRLGIRYVLVYRVHVKTFPTYIIMHDEEL